MVSTAEKNALAFEVLSDVGQNVGRAFGLVYEFTEELKSAYQGFKLDIPAHNDSPGEWALPVSATYVIDRNGMIVYACTDPDYRDRADPRDVLKVLTERAVAATEAKLRGLPRTAGGNDAEAALHRGKRTAAPHARIDRIRQTHRRARPARRQPDDAEQAWHRLGRILEQAPVSGPAAAQAQGNVPHQNLGRAPMRLLLDRSLQCRQSRGADRKHDQRSVRLCRQRQV